MSKRMWITKAGATYKLYEDMLEQHHLLIAGATGTGKSVLINSLIYTALYKLPTEISLVLIDPKRVELVDYKYLPHTVAYVNDTNAIISTLEALVDRMEARYKRMQRDRIKKSTDSRILVVIDEYTDLIVQSKKRVEPLIIRLSQLGRAANIMLILATQRPTRDIVTGSLKVNMDTRIALRCPTPQDSRNIIDVKGAESLPMYGQGYYRTSAALQLVSLPMIPEEEVKAQINHWLSQRRWYDRFI